MYKMLKLDKKIDVEGIYTFFYCEHDSKYNNIGEKHDFWEMVYVDSGEIYAASDSSGFTLSQGDVLFHKPMEFHGMTSVHNKPHNVLIITFDSKSEAMSFFKKKIFSVNSKQKKLLAEILKEFKTAFKAGMYNSAREKVVFSREESWAYQIGVQQFEHFLLELMRENNVVKHSEKENSLAKKNVKNAIAETLKEYMSENLYTALSLDDVCRYFNMSKSYLSQLFKLETGSSIMDYYIELKIREAKYLIREGELNFTQISEKLGYTSLQHFTRTFKSREKMSPSLYEKSIK